MANYQTAQADYADSAAQSTYYNQQFKAPNLQSLAGASSGLGSFQATQAPSGLLTVLEEVEKQAANLDARLHSIRISLFGSQLNSSIECGEAKDAHVPSARETAMSISKTLDRIASTVASLEQQIGGR